MKDETGRAEYWSELAAECQDSSLIHLLENALGLPGDVVECGVYRGASLRRIAKTVKDRSPNKTVFGLDSFEGFPSAGVSDEDTSQGRSVHRLAGKFKDANDAPERLAKFAEVFDIDLDLRKGYFETTLPSLVAQQICFLHIDCDTYSGHVEVLDALYDRVVPGGYVVFDDYNDKAWPGATKAVDEFFGKRGIDICLDETRTDPAWFVLKPSEPQS